MWALARPAAVLPKGAPVPAAKTPTFSLCGALTRPDRRHRPPTCAGPNNVVAFTEPSEDGEEGGFQKSEHDGKQWVLYEDAASAVQAATLAAQEAATASKGLKTQLEDVQTQLSTVQDQRSQLADALAAVEADRDARGHELDGAQRMLEASREELTAALGRAEWAEQEAMRRARDAEDAANTAREQRSAIAADAAHRMRATAADAAAAFVYGLLPEPKPVERERPTRSAEADSEDGAEEVEEEEEVEELVDERPETIDRLRATIIDALGEVAYTYAEASAADNASAVERAAVAEAAAKAAVTKAVREAADARAAAQCAEESAMQRLDDANANATSATRGAAERVANEYSASLTLSMASADAAHAMAARAAGSARTAMAQQENIQRSVRAIRVAAAAADARAQASHQEALSLRKEVANLRARLQETTAALTKARADADADARASSAHIAKIQEEATQRVWEAETAMSQQIDAALKGYETLKKATTERAETAEALAAEQLATSESLAEQVEELRSRLGAADSAVAQANAKMEAMVAELRAIDAARQKAAEAEVATKMDAISAFREGVRAKLESEVLNNVQMAVSHAMREVEAAKVEGRAEVCDLQSKITVADAERDYWRDRAQAAEANFIALRSEVRQLVQVKEQYVAGESENGLDPAKVQWLSTTTDRLDEFLDGSEVWRHYIAGFESFALPDDLVDDGCRVVLDNDNGN